MKSKTPAPPPAAPPAPQIETQARFSDFDNGMKNRGGGTGANGAGGVVGGSSPLTAEALAMQMGSRKALGS